MKSVKVFRPIYGFSAIITGTQIVCGGEQRYRPEMFAKAQGVTAKSLKLYNLALATFVDADEDGRLPVHQMSWKYTSVTSCHILSMFVLHYMKFSHEVLAQQISYIAIPSIVAETFFFPPFRFFITCTRHNACWLKSI